MKSQILADEVTRTVVIDQDMQPTARGLYVTARGRIVFQYVNGQPVELVDVPVGRVIRGLIAAVLDGTDAGVKAIYRAGEYGTRYGTPSLANFIAEDGPSIVTEDDTEIVVPGY